MLARRFNWRFRALFAVLACALSCGYVPNGVAMERNGSSASKEICKQLSVAGDVVQDAAFGCRWRALPERLLLGGEVVELSLRPSADDVRRQGFYNGHDRYIARMKQAHLLTKTSELDPCLDGAPAGRRIIIYQAKHTEVYGYAQCGGQTVSLKVSLDKYGGTSPGAVFDELMQRVVPILGAGAELDSH
jgi:hypothetical protein